MAELEVNEATYDVIDMLKKGERTPRQFIAKKEHLRKQGVDVDLIEKRLIEKGALKGGGKLGIVSQAAKNVKDDVKTFREQLGKKKYKKAYETGVRLTGKMMSPVIGYGRGPQEFYQGAVKGATLGYVDPFDYTKGSGGIERGVGEAMGGILPYMIASPIGAPLRAVKGVGMAARLARIAGSAAPMATVGALRPGGIKERAKSAAIEGLIGGGLQAIPEVMGALKKPTAQLLSKTLGRPPQDVLDTFGKPSRYWRKPPTTKQEQAITTRIKDSVVQNVDDLTGFKIKTIEDKVAAEMSKKIPARIGSVEQQLKTGKTIKAPKYMAAMAPQKGTRINSGTIKAEVNKYVSEMMEAGVVDDIPKPLQRLLQRIDRESTKAFNDVTGKYTNTLTFEQAHKLKQEIYKIVKKAYGKENFTAVAAEGYKRAAKKINGMLRELSPEYAAANDQVRAIYELNEAIGRKGVERFSEIGGTKKFRSLFNDPEGRQLLAKIEQLLPESKRFMPKLEALEKAKELGKFWQQPKAREALFGGGGTALATYYLTRNPMLAGAVGTISGITGSPMAIRKLGQLGLGTASRLGRIPIGVRGIIPAAAQALKGSNTP